MPPDIRVYSIWIVDLKGISALSTYRMVAWCSSSSPLEWLASFAAHQVLKVIEICFHFPFEKYHKNREIVAEQSAESDLILIAIGRGERRVNIK